MKRRWKKFPRRGAFSAAPRAEPRGPAGTGGQLDDRSSFCSVTSVFLYPEYVGRVDGENVSCIQGEVSYDHGLLTFQGDVTLTTVELRIFGTVPLVEALSEKKI